MCLQSHNVKEIFCSYAFGQNVFVQRLANYGLWAACGPLPLPTPGLDSNGIFFCLWRRLCFLFSKTTSVSTQKVGKGKTPSRKPRLRVCVCVCRWQGGKPDLNTALPIRQTASIFKQPVTKVTSHPGNKVKTDSQRATEQPRQVREAGEQSHANTHARARARAIERGCGLPLGGGEAPFQRRVQQREGDEPEKAGLDQISGSD